MKISDGFILRRVIDNWIVVPIGNNASRSSCMLSLNESSVLLWKALEDGCGEEALAELLCGKYLVDKETALSDTRKFLNSLEAVGALSHE